MSHQIVECPGCLTKLRVRESSKTITLQCPRCGEHLAVDPPEAPSAPVPPVSRPTTASPKAPSPQSAPAHKPTASTPASTRPAANSKPAAPPPKRATETPAATAKPPRSQTASASSKPVRKPRKDDEFDDPWNSGDSYTAPSYDEYGNYGQAQPSRKKSPQPKGGGSGFLTGLLIGGGVALAAVLIFAAVSFMKDSSSSPTANQNSVAAVTTPQPDAAGASSQGITSEVPADASLAGNNTGTVSSATAPESFLPGAPSLPGPAAMNPPASSASSSSAISADSRRLRYHWKPGAEYMYQFTVEQGSGDDVRRTTGMCTYHVRGDSRQVITEEEGSGTGFVVSPDGVIATCAHVVEGAKRIEVHLGGRTYPATVIAMNPRTDVALIRISASGLPSLPLADSDTVQLAESVRAIGFPLSDVLGTDVKVTTGTVAGIIQSRERGKQIHIDAAINPGNSGGPVVNGAGQVVGVASAKLSGASVTSVGFAAPVNELRTLAAANNLPLPVASRSGDLAGPEIARRVTPAVAFIKVWGNSGGKMYEVTFNATFHEQPQMRSIRGGFPGPPSFGSTSIDNGKLTVNGLGEVLNFEGSEQLPAVLGPVGVFFLEPLDAYSESQWNVETESRLQRIKRDDGPFGGMGPRFGGRMRGFGPPGMFGRQEDQVVEEIPAIERVSYQVGQTLNNRISIAKNYEYTATRSNNQPYLTIRGNGTLVFDTVQGMPASLEYAATVEQTDEDGTAKVPVKVNYTLRDPEDVKREREQMAQKAAADKQQKEQEQTVPNPQLVTELIAQVRKAEGGHGASQPLSKLAGIAIVEEKRDEVLRLAQNHMKNSNGFVKKSATEVLCHWATENEVPELRKILADNDGLLHDAKRRAIRTVAKHAKPADYPDIILAISDFVIRNDVKEALIGIGPDIEVPILETFPKLTDAGAKNELLEVLKKIGTKKSEDFLEKLATSSDFSVRHNAQQALDAVRARL